MSGGFLNYLDDFETKSEKVVEKVVNKKNIVKENKPVLTKKTIKKTIKSDEPKNLIDKLSSLDQKDLDVFEEAVDKIIARRSGKVEPKKEFKIKPKKIIKDPIKETTNHALNILDGLPDTPSSLEVVVETNQSQQPVAPIPTQPQDFNLENVKGHASALL